MKFKLHSQYKPAGDQPKAIKTIVDGFNSGKEKVTLMGVTGSGKTFTVANVIEKLQKPTLVIAHNKTLAAQLASEYQEFFPENAVHYFVSYYDYYQPEAYMPGSDTYIEKEAQINAEIDRLRHASTQALLTRKDVIIVASVSCIYGLGSPEEYEKENFKVLKGAKIPRNDFIRKLVQLHYERTLGQVSSGVFRATGNYIDFVPTSETYTVRFTFEGDIITSILIIDSITRKILEEREYFFIFPAKHFITSKDEITRAVKSIEKELESRLTQLLDEGKLLEAERLKRRTRYDLALIKETGYCNGIENYSRHFSGKKPGEAPDSLLSYFPHKPDGSPDFLTVIDESHITVSQIGAMYAGDKSRKDTLIEHGFRLPSALDNRPQKFDEFEKFTAQTLYTSATPGKYEKEVSETIAEQIIRPTGLVDPELVVKPITSSAVISLGEVSSRIYSGISQDNNETPKQVRGDNVIVRSNNTIVRGDNNDYPGQVEDFIIEAQKTIEAGERVIATTLTKKMSEDLSEYLEEKGFRTKYLHSEIDTLERIEILTSLRKGEYDILVGVNLLREGIDMPEVSLIAVFDADKEGFLRSETSLIQTIGRAARNVNGRVILYADEMTRSMKNAIDETNRRREIQKAYNKEHNITPQTIKSKIKDITDQFKKDHDKAVDNLLKIDLTSEKNIKQIIKEKKSQMEDAVQILDFETAALLRDELFALEEIQQKNSKKPLKKNKK
jgi:excinuclease ABC subunit B